MGKTSAILAWTSTLNKIGADHVSVAVACSKVEALCDIQRDLMAMGAPEQQIGLRHSYHDASLPSTEDDDRQIMLVTHARVRDGEKLKHFSHYQGIERGHRDGEPHQAAARYLDHCIAVIRAKLAEPDMGHLSAM